MKKPASIVLLLCTIIFSCSKEEDSSQVNPNTVKFGDYSTISILNEHSIQIPVSQFSGDEDIDINNDGLMDFGISFYINSTMTGQSHRFSFYTLNTNSFYFAQTQNDTASYINYDDTTIQGDTTIINIGNERSCGSGFDSVIFQSNEHIIYYEAGRSLLLSDQMSGDTILMESNSHSAFGWFNPSSDTLWWRQTKGSSCQNIPKNTVSYIGIKVSSNGKDKFGWIKIREDDGYIWIEESALQ